MVTFLASILIWLMFFGLLVLWVVDGNIKKETVIHALFSAVVAWILTDIVKILFPAPRPFELHGLFTGTLTIPYGGTFPSTHTAVGFALSACIYAHDKKTGILYFAMAALVGVARILANVHYPIDIMGGALVGLISFRLTSSRHFARLLKR